MSDNSDNRAPRYRELHPTIYVGVVGLAIWLVAAAWGFGETAQTDYLIAVVTGFFTMAIGLPTVLWWAGRRAAGDNEARMPIRDWLSAQVEIAQGRLSGREAALQILLPIAALSVGMTAIVIVMHLES